MFTAAIYTLANGWGDGNHLMWWRYSNDAATPKIRALLLETEAWIASL
jgi:hypothetical protein